MKRPIQNKISKPNYSGQYREVHGVLRNSEGLMVFSEFKNGNVVYKLTNIRDLPIKANSEGRREFNKKWLNVLYQNVIDYEFKGELFMYCTHQEDQKLLPISQFTINRANTQFHRMNSYGFPIQPYCKESKKKYQNQPGNKLRTKQQLFEGSVGYRTRALTTALKLNDETPNISEVWEKFRGRCYDTDKILDVNDRSSYQIDHLMPACGYHPLTKKTAVLLSKDANQRKKDHHPLNFYGRDKFEKLCNILNIDVDKYNDPNYILNDTVLIYFNENFEDVIQKWYEINRNENSFKKYLKKEIKRIKRLDIYVKHVSLIKKLENYEKNI